jgi:hypothetical protein
LGDAESPGGISMDKVEKQLKTILEELREIKFGLNPLNSGIASELGSKIDGVAKRLEKIEKKLGI